MIDHPVCLFLRRHRWISFASVDQRRGDPKLWACVRCGKVRMKDD